MLGTGIICCGFIVSTVAKFWKRKHTQKWEHITFSGAQSTSVSDIASDQQSVVQSTLSREERGGQPDTKLHAEGSLSLVQDTSMEGVKKAQDNSPLNIKEVATRASSQAVRLPEETNTQRQALDTWFDNAYSNKSPEISPAVISNTKRVFVFPPLLTTTSSSHISSREEGLTITAGAEEVTRSAPKNDNERPSSKEND